MSFALKLVLQGVFSASISFSAEKLDCKSLSEKILRLNNNTTPEDTLQKGILSLTDSELIQQVKDPKFSDIKNGGNTAQKVVELPGNFVARVANNTPTNREDLQKAQRAAQSLSQQALLHSAPVLRVVEDGSSIIAIAPLARGKQLGSEPTPADIRMLAEIPQEHFNSLVSTMRELREKQLLVDSDPDNLFYHPEDGFRVIDLNTTTEGRDVPTDAIDVANYLVGQTEFVSRGTDTVFDFYQEHFGWNSTHMRTLATKIKIAVAESNH